MGPRSGPPRRRDARRRPYRDELCHRFEIRTSEAPARIVLLTSKCIRGQDDGIAGWVGTLADITAEVGAESAMVDARDEATRRRGSSPISWPT